MKLKAVGPLIVVLVATGCEAGGGPVSPSPSAGDIVIASDLPSSAFAPLIGPMQQAIHFAVDHAGISGFKVTYMPLDDSLAGKPSAEKGVQNVKHMIADHRVLGMIGPWSSSVGYGEIPLANAADLVILSPTNTDLCLTEPASFCDVQPDALRPTGPNNYFRIAAPEPLQGRAMARFAAGVLHLTRAAVFNEWGQVGHLVIDDLRSEFARAGGVLVLSQDLQEGTSDFKGFLTEAKMRGAQAILAVTGNEKDHVCKARAQMPRILPDETPFIATDGVAFSDICVADAADNASGMYFTSSEVDPTHSADPAVKRVIDAFQTAHPDASDNPSWTFAAYDCTEILIDAIKRTIGANGGRIPTRAQVIDSVARSQFTGGVTGDYSFDQQGDARSPLMSVYELRNSRWAYVQKIDVSAQGT